MTRKQRVTRLVYGLYVAFLAVFVASNIIQVSRVVFAKEPPAKTSGEAASPKVGPACAAALAAEIRAIDTAQARALGEPSTEAAGARYVAERRSSGPTDGKTAPAGPAETCSSDPNGADALAALARLDRMAEGHAVRSAGELSTVRLAAQSFIRDEPR